MALLSHVLIVCGILLFLGYKGNAGSLLGESTMRLDKFEQCPDRLNISNVLFNVSLNNIGFGKVKLFGKFKVGRDIIRPASLKAVIHKCASKEEPDTCEYYYTYKMDNFCDELPKKDMPWDSFFKQTNIPRLCPIRKNVYSLDGVVFETSDMLNMPVLNGYWKVRSSGKSDGKLIFCTSGEFLITQKQSKRKRPRN